MPEPSDEWYIEQVDDSPFLNAKAKTTYKYAVHAIKRICAPGSIHRIITSPEVYGPKLLASKIPDHSKKTYLTTVLTLLRTSGLKASDKDLFVKWYKHYMQISEQISERENSNIPTERQAQNQIDWQDVLKVRDELPVGSLPHLVLSIYTYVPPRRQMDYMAMRVYTHTDAVTLNHNHFQLYSKKYKSPYMFINHFKNSKHFKSFFNKEIPPELVQAVKASLKDAPRDYLFTQSNGKPYTDINSFSHFTNRLLKLVFARPGMSVNVLRHSFATYANTIPDITIGERQRNAIKMGHSLKKTMEYALKKQDPPLSMLNTNSRSPVKDECYKKNPVTKKLVKMPCPSAKKR